MTKIFDIGKGSPNAAQMGWEGLSKVLKGINKEMGKLENASVDGLLEAALLIRGDAQRITPVDTGNLKASAYVMWGGKGRSIKSKSEPLDQGEMSKRKNTGPDHATVISQRDVANQKNRSPFAEIGYTANYAAAVHERLKSRHAKPEKKGGRMVQIGQAKFLEQAFLQNEKRVLQIIRRRAKIK
ncbi:MAG: hypothetical protein GY821_12635 [Gammaproteobacteria bacterium]|nr:hypothetical protein [Gammaproteobacteria bacterium]